MHLGPHTCNSLSQIEYTAACTCDTPHPVPMKINTHMSHTLVVCTCMNTYERMNTYTYNQVTYAPEDIFKEINLLLFILHVRVPVIIYFKIF